MERWQAELIGLGFYAVVAAWPAYRALTAGRPARVRAWATTQGLQLGRTLVDPASWRVRREGPVAGTTA